MYEKTEDSSHGPGAVLFLGSCNNAEEPGYSYEIPPKTSDRWEVSSSNEVGLDSLQLIEMVDYLASLNSVGSILPST